MLIKDGGHGKLKAAKHQHVTVVTRGFVLADVTIQFKAVKQQNRAVGLVPVIFFMKV